MPSTSWYWCLCCGMPFDTKDLMTCRKQITYHCGPCHKGGHQDTRPVMKRKEPKLGVKKAALV